MESLVRTLQGYGIGRLAAIIGAAAGAAAILIAVMMRVGGEPRSLLYANVDLKEASQITAALDGAGIKYEVKGDGSTIMVDRDKVASTRLLLSGKGLPTSGSVGYEIFDSAPAMGQTDFVQNLNRQRALEGELARTIRSIQGVSYVKVHLVMPKRQLFEQETAQPTASIMITTSAGRLSDGQVRAIRNLVAGAVPDLKSDHITVVDQQGELLAAEGEDGGIGDAGGSARADIEERIRHKVKEVVEGVVGAGKARVQVTADLDLSRVTTQSEKFDPDSKVERSTSTKEDKSSDTKAANSGQTSASQNVPGAQGANTSTPEGSNTTGTEETTNYEISKTTTTEIQEPGKVKRLSVAVAVDGVTGPSVGGKPGAYRPRTPAEMDQIQKLVQSAVGYDQTRNDQVSVVNVRFDPSLSGEGVTAASPLNFDKNDIMRGAELGVMALVAGLIIFFVVKPMLKTASGGMSASGMAMAQGAAGGGALAGSGGQALALAAPENDMGLDIARIEGQVRASSVKKVAEFVEKHPDESVSILRSWLHES